MVKLPRRREVYFDHRQPAAVTCENFDLAPSDRWFGVATSRTRRYNEAFLCHVEP
jgi:hypothetical protein